MSSDAGGVIRDARGVFSDPRDIRGIQYLRAVAALMVVAHHARHYFPAGDTWTTLGSRGVDIFFVISGFVMAHTTHAFDPNGDVLGQARGFLSKRFIRVVPLYWIALVWTAKRDLWAAAPPPELWKDFIFWPHFHAIYTDAIYPVLVPGWTINYEIFFYLLFAASFAFRRWRYVALLSLLCTLPLLGTLPLSSPPAIFYTRTAVLEFALGIVVYASLRRWPGPLPTPAAVAVSVASLGGLSIENSDAIRGLCDGPFAALLVWSSVQWTQRLALKPLHALGDASYSIYLFHLAALAVPTWAMRRAGIVEPTTLAVTFALLVQVAFAAAIGVAIHRLLERPLLRLLRRKLKRTHASAWASSAT